MVNIKFIETSRGVFRAKKNPYDSFAKSRNENEFFFENLDDPEIIYNNTCFLCNSQIPDFKTLCASVKSDDDKKIAQNPNPTSKSNFKIEQDPNSNQLLPISNPSSKLKSHVKKSSSKNIIQRIQNGIPEGKEIQETKENSNDRLPNNHDERKNKESAIKSNNTKESAKNDILQTEVHLNSAVVKNLK